MLWTKHRNIPYHYFLHRLYNRSARPDFIDYLPAKLFQHYRRTFNPPSHIHMLNDKRETVRVLAGTGVRCVETLFSVSAEGNVLKGDGSSADAESAACALRNQGGLLFVKPIDSRGGYGASRLEAARIDASLLGSMRNVIIQPVLRNHPVIAALFPGTLNTVRVCTFLEDGHCTIIAALLKIGQGTAVVDNWSQGAIAIRIDPASGALDETGITKPLFGRRTHAAHPNTGIRFASVILPWWRETLVLAERAAQGLLPHATLGLDVAITPDGPVLVEANGAGNVFQMQEVCGPLGYSILGRRVLAHWLNSRKAR